MLWECPAYGSLLYRGCLGMNLSTSSHLVVSRRRPLCWVVSCGRISAIQSCILDMWELRKIRLYGDNPSIEQSQSEIAPGELQGVAGCWGWG